MHVAADEMPAPRVEAVGEAPADEVPAPHVEAVDEAPADEVVGRYAVEQGGTFVRDAVWRRFPHGVWAARWS